MWRYYERVPLSCRVTTNRLRGELVRTSSASRWPRRYADRPEHRSRCTTIECDTVGTLKRDTGRLTADDDRSHGRAATGARDIEACDQRAKLSQRGVLSTPLGAAASNNRIENVTARFIALSRSLSPVHSFRPRPRGTSTRQACANSMKMRHCGYAPCAKARPRRCSAGNDERPSIQACPASARSIARPHEAAPSPGG